MNKQHLKLFSLISIIRKFFTKENFIDVLTPPAVQNPGMETHIHPFKVSSMLKKNKEPSLFLHTSPEFCMKELLSEGLSKIFTISYCFRDEPTSIQHRAQFLMLEWYRANEHYSKIMDDCEFLITNCYQQMGNQSPSFIRKTIQEVFIEFINIDILNFLKVDEIKKLIENKFPEVPLPNSIENMEWDDYYFLLFLNKIEPQLKKYPYLILFEFPYQLAALSTIKENDSRVCERFEIYIDGIEIANSFNELCDLNTLKQRFDIQGEQKQDLYQYQLPTPSNFYKTMEKGLPPSAGIALGVERLFMAITKSENPFWD